MTHDPHEYGESGVPSISPTTVSHHGHYPPPAMYVMPSAPPAPARDPSSTIMMAVGVVMLVALSIIGVQLGRKDRADHPDHAAAATKPAAAAVSPPPPSAVSALPAAAVAPKGTSSEPPLSIELEDSESVPTINANKLPDVAPGPPATADTAIHRNVVVPPNPY